MSGDAGYTDQEAPILEKMIMDSRCEKTKSESWARDEITRLREENSRLRETLRPFAKMADELDVLSNGEELWEDSDDHWIDCHQFDEVPTVGNLRAAAAAIREGGKGD